MINIAMIGAGATGKRYAQHLSATGQARVAGICGENGEAAAELAEQCGCRVFSAFEALIESLPPGSVLVFTGASDSRRRNILHALETGYHVITEMPAAFRPEELQEMLAARTSRSRLLFTNPGRFAHHNTDLRKRIAAGTIGSLGVINVKRYCPLTLIPEDQEQRRHACRSHAFEPGLTEAAWASGIRWTGGLREDQGEERAGGALYRLALQDIDILRWIAGEAASVYAMRTASERLDYILATIKFRNGAIANLEAYWGYPGDYASAAEYAGSGGVIRYDSRKTDALHLYKYAEAEVHPGHRGFSPSFRNPEYADLLHLLDCIKEGREPVTAAEDALETMNLAWAASQSIRTGLPVEPVSCVPADASSASSGGRRGGGDNA
ncbi:Gfo/Idh/MocA family oxidoreductase [Paenibacillus doosanensis]|uniref:Gfo/Idh/MocA family protein n=1 Tax=Paenibacillus doosanensis TaxID=1229154 RepID=UPI00217FABFB|nr:Gfo/Idh/MocA family oxidoreductase [Paenibacillus doosanensis]MCS7462858.1 Gfo/Idh/MocA family oxidoreductase [Paenibacillus doosanensis]